MGEVNPPVEQLRKTRLNGLCLHFMNHLILFCNESRGKDEKSTATIASCVADEQILQTRAVEKSRMRQGPAIYFDIQN